MRLHFPQMMVVEKYGLWKGMVFYNLKGKEKESWCQIFFYRGLDLIFFHFSSPNKKS